MLSLYVSDRSFTKAHFSQFKALTVVKLTETAFQKHHSQPFFKSITRNRPIQIQIFLIKSKKTRGAEY